jgi:hypothetical protein
MAKALELWSQETIEEALGAEAAGVLPEAVRLVDRMSGCRALAARMVHAQPAGVAAMVLIGTTHPREADLSASETLENRFGAVANRSGRLENRSSPVFDRRRSVRKRSRSVSRRSNV